MSWPEPGGVWLVEGDGHGHRLEYLRLLYDALVAQGRRPVVVVPSYVKQRAAWGQRFGEVPDLPVWSPPDAADGSRFRQSVVRAARTLRTHLVIPDADRWIPSLRRVPVAGSLLVMRAHPRPGAGPRTNGVVKRRLAKHLLRRGWTVATLELDVRLQDPAWTEIGALAVPDPVAFASNAEEIARIRALIPERSRLLLVIGDISERKHVAEIVTGWQRAERTDTVLALVGQQSPGVSSMLAGLTEEGLHPVDEHLTDDRFDSWIAAADAVCVMYDTVGSSGVALKATAAGTPVIVGGNDYLIRGVELIGVPYRVVTPEPDTIAAFVRDDDWPTRAPGGDLSDRIATFAETLTSHLGVGVGADEDEAH